MSGTVPMISVTDAELDELRTRLLNTRWPTAWPLNGWDAGTAEGEPRRLVEYWASDDDWRVHEAAVNALRGSPPARSSRTPTRSAALSSMSPPAR